MPTACTSWRNAALLIGLGAMIVCGPAIAQGYPAKSVSLIVPFPPDGVTDLNARILAKHLSKFWGQPVTVTNMPGGGGTKGTMFVLGSAKDGYTMMMSATGQATQNPAIDSKLPYKWDEPTLVARTSISPLVFVVKGDSPWRSLREVVDDVKKDPAKYKYGTSGPGGVGSIALSLLFGSNGVDVQKLGRVELQGGAPMLDTVATGETHLPRNISPRWVRSSQARAQALAVSTATRVKQLPDTPTSLEAGFDTFTLIGWNESSARRSSRPTSSADGTMRSRRSPPTARSSRRPKRRAPKSPISTRSGSRPRSRRNRDGVQQLAEHACCVEESLPAVRRRRRPHDRQREDPDGALAAAHGVARRPKRR